MDEHRRKQIEFWMAVVRTVTGIVAVTAFVWLNLR